MKTYSLSLIALACSVALTACSSSRGGDSVDTSKYLTEKPQVKPQTSPTVPTSPTKPTPPTSPTKPTAPAQNESGNVAPSPSVSPSQPITADKPAESKPSATQPEATPPMEAEPPQPLSPSAEKPSTSLPPFEPTLFQPNDGALLTGAIVEVKADGSTQGRQPQNDGKQKLNELMIDNVKIHIFTANDLLNGNGADGFKTLSTKDIDRSTPISGDLSGYASGWGSEASYDTRIFRNMRFGVVNLNQINHLFVQGYLSPVGKTETVLQDTHYPVPKSGKFLYHTGYALYGKDGHYQPLNAEVEADFGEKTLKVALKDRQDNHETLTFSGHIDGNRFAGSSNGIESRGAFYGSLAKEVGGVFYQTQGAEKGANGVFGAVDPRVIR